MTITPDSPLIGPPSGTLDAALDYAGTDNAEYVKEVWRLGLMTGLDPALIVAQACHETADFTSPRWVKNRNPAGLGIEADSDADPATLTQTEAARLHVWAIQDAIESTATVPFGIPGPAFEFVRRWTKKTDAPEFPRPVVSVADLQKRYVDSSGEPQAVWAWDDRYAVKLIAKHRAIFGTDAATTVQSEGANAQMSTPATIDYSPLPVPVLIDLIGEDQPNQNPGIAITPTSGTWHETANEGNGTDALMHQRYINNGCPDENGNPTKTSWHFTADEDRIIQHLALNRAAWHGGDSATGLGPSVYSIAVECCVNRDGNLAKAQENVAALFGLLRAEGIIKDVYQHNKWSGKDCPRKLRNGVTMSWATAQAKISGYAAKYAGQDTPQPSPIWWEPGDDWGPQTRTHDGAIAWAFLGEVTAKRNVPIRRDAHKDAAVVYHLKAGSRVRIVGTHVAANKVRWAFIETEPGKYGRAVLSAFTPYRWPTV